MEFSWMEEARYVANKQSVHSSAGQGEPEGWSFPSWWQNKVNLAWANEYDLRVEGTKPCDYKEKHCCSKEGMSGPAGVGEGSK